MGKIILAIPGFVYFLLALVFWVRWASSESSDSKDLLIAIIFHSLFFYRYHLLGKGYNDVNKREAEEKLSRTLKDE